MANIAKDYLSITSVVCEGRERERVKIYLKDLIPFSVEKHNIETS
jgi:hypothetical protein